MFHPHYQLNSLLGNHFNSLKKTFSNENIETYFNIEKTNPNESLKFNFLIINKERKLKFFLKYYDIYSCIYFKDLPPEINELIKKYCFRIIESEFIISYPNRYPFEQQKWELHSINHNYFEDIEKIFLDIVESHNKDFKLNHTPLRIEKDILNFIVKLEPYISYLSSKRSGSELH